MVVLGTVVDIASSVNISTCAILLLTLALEDDETNPQTPFRIASLSNSDYSKHQSSIASLSISIYPYKGTELSPPQGLLSGIQFLVISNVPHVVALPLSATWTVIASSLIEIVVVDERI